MMKMSGPTDALGAGTTTLSDDDLSNFLSKTESATFGFFTTMIKGSNSIYLMAILINIVVGRLRLV
jgi:hypothetical protein